MAKSRSTARKTRQARVRNRIFGTPEKPRLNVYRSLTSIYVQLVDDRAGQTLASASTIDKDLRAQMKGKNKSEQARLVGQAIAERAQKRGIKSVVFDRGGFRYAGRVKALADGAREAGLQF